MTVLVRSGALSTPFIQHPVLNIDWTCTAIGVMLMFAVGAIDDIYDLRARYKLIGQVIASCIIAYSGVLLISIGDPTSNGYIELGWLAYPITVFYIVSFANIINLIDGLDGLAGGISLIATTAIMVFAWASTRYDALVLGFAMIGALLGFLKYNKHPASIFMGDSGSLMLGTLLAITSLVAVSCSSLFTSLLVPLLAAGVPIIDTFSAIVRRKRQHVSIGNADKQHIHHRLLAAGYSHETVVTIMLLWSLALSAGGVAITLLRGPIRYIVFTILLILSAVMIKKLNLFQPVLEHHYTSRDDRKNNLIYDTANIQHSTTQNDTQKATTINDIMVNDSQNAMGTAGIAKPYNSSYDMQYTNKSNTEK